MSLSCNKINLSYPIRLLNNSLYTYNTTEFTIKYLQTKTIEFIKQIHFLTKMNYNLTKLFKSVKKKHIKSKGDINKSTRKPWAQKKLGRARAGSFKSPLWRGGGKIFGPKTRKLKFKVNKKIIKLTLFYALLNKRSHIVVICIHSLLHSFYTLDTHIKQQLRINGIFSKKVLFVSMLHSNFSNPSSFKFISVNNLNLKLILDNEFILFLI